MDELREVVEGPKLSRHSFIPSALVRSDTLLLTKL